MHGTAYDYFRFGQMMLNKGELDGVRVLSNKAVELMTQPIPGKHKKSFFTGNFWVYGVEVQMEDTPSDPGQLVRRQRQLWLARYMEHAVE